MATVSRSVADHNGHPVAGATVSIFDPDGVLVDEVTTNAAGVWSAELDAGTYFLVITKGDALMTREIFVCPA